MDQPLGVLPVADPRTSAAATGNRPVFLRSGTQKPSRQNREGGRPPAGGDKVDGFRQEDAGTGPASLLNAT